MTMTIKVKRVNYLGWKKIKKNKKIIRKWKNKMRILKAEPYSNKKNNLNPLLKNLKTRNKRKN